MADEVDNAAETAELLNDAAIRAARRPVPVGEPGTCSQCDEDMPRLVHGRCGFCRDGKVNPRSLV